MDRALFLPDRIWQWDMVDKTSTCTDKTVSASDWYAAADSNTPLVTQWDDGRHTGTAAGGVATSSSSMPSVVYQLLHDLDADDGMNILDVGTGTGETSGALTHRFGPQRVTTLEVDRAVSQHAEQRLHAAGLHPTVVVGEGAAGHRRRAPYHRVLLTFSLHHLPGALIEQTSTGGLIVAPWGTHYSHANAVARLTVTGNTASGHFTRAVEFMESRSQRRPRIAPSDYVPPEGVQGADTSSTTITDEQFAGGRYGPLPFILGLRVPGCVQAAADKRGPSRPVWLYSLTDRSWACAMLRDDSTPARVWQSGPRRLWDEVESAYFWWAAQGSPGVERFGLTVTPGGQKIWLDDPRNTWPV
ncbi:protein-L-isoaspartate O-methyltransferase [Streptomyces kronopolitis]|uniref:protein-L-isoaspartate O-methyltransferase family protein n=1 Tax=Streptomyces kronopolitis TaxID=1612435 RepID=UPI0036779BA7